MPALPPAPPNYPPPQISQSQSSSSGTNLAFSSTEPTSAQIQLHSPVYAEVDERDYEEPITVNQPPSEPLYTYPTPCTDHEPNSAQDRNNRRVIRPPGIRKYFIYATFRNLLVLGLLLTLVILAFVVYQSNIFDEGTVDTHKTPIRPLKGVHKILKVNNVSLGEYTNDRRINLSPKKISFDEIANAIILSEYDLWAQIIKWETKYLENPLSEFIYTAQSIENIASKYIVGTYLDCIRFTEEVFCCSNSNSMMSDSHRTDCYLQQDIDSMIRSSAPFYDFLHNWQNLKNGSKLLIVYNKRGHGVLNLRTKRIWRIIDYRLPNGYFSPAFFFPNDIDDELHELVSYGNEFFICPYIKKCDKVEDTRCQYIKKVPVSDIAWEEDGYESWQEYELKNGNMNELKVDHCELTPFKVDFKLRRILFCEHVLYMAIIQYGHLSEEFERLTWRLRVKFNNATEVFYAAESIKAPEDMEQLVMKCNDNELDIFAMGTKEVHQFIVELPTKIRPTKKL